MHVCMCIMPQRIDKISVVKSGLHSAMPNQACPSLLNTGIDIHLVLALIPLSYIL